MRNSMFNRLAVCLTVASILCAAGTAQASSIVNGGFEQTTGNTANSFFLANSSGSLVGWNVGAFLGHESSVLFAPGEADAGGAFRNGDNFNLGLWNTTAASLTSPSGGNFVAFDGDSAFSRATLSQTVTGLVPNTTYEIRFEWAAAQYKNLTDGVGFDGATTSAWQVTLGSETHTTTPVSILSHGFSGWRTQSFTFHPTNSTEVLTFLAIGTPDGFPPVSLLDGVSLEIVPTPGALGTIALGLLGSGVARPNRRDKAASK